MPPYVSHALFLCLVFSGWDKQLKPAPNFVCCHSCDQGFWIVHSNKPACVQPVWPRLPLCDAVLTWLSWLGYGSDHDCTNPQTPEPSHVLLADRRTVVQGIFRSIFQCAKQGFWIGIIITHWRATKEWSHAELLQGRQHGCAFHWTAIVWMQGDLVAYNPIVLNRMDQELDQQSFGSTYIVERLLELLCAEALRSQLENLGETSGWYKGLRDPVVGRAIAMIHSQPGDHWSIERLANGVAMSPSRSTARFTTAMGIKPHCNTWRNGEWMLPAASCKGHSKEYRRLLQLSVMRICLHLIELLRSM